MKKLIVFTLLIVLISSQQDNEELMMEEELEIILPYQKRIIEHPDAKCLDGTQSAYYYFAGKSTDLLIYFYGGGFCVDEGEGIDSLWAQVDNCEKRKTMFYGGTNGFPETFDAGQGIMGNDKTKNPLFAEATKIWIMYCDGSLYYKQMSKDILQNLLENLKLQPQRVLLIGSEAGGLYILSQHKLLTEAIKQTYENVDISIIIENATLLFHHQYVNDEEQVDQLYTQLQSVGKRIQKSVDELTDIQQLTDTETRIFLIQPQYDWWQLQFSFNEDCHKYLHMSSCTLPQITRINEIRTFALNRLLNLIKNAPNLSLWSIGCFWKESITWDEAYNSEEHRIPYKDGINLHEAISLWLNEKTRQIHYDHQLWPGNKSCSHLPTQDSEEDGNNSFESMFVKEKDDL